MCHVDQHGVGVVFYTPSKRVIGTAVVIIADNTKRASWRLTYAKNISMSPLAEYNSLLSTCY